MNQAYSASQSQPVARAGDSVFRNLSLPIGGTQEALAICDEMQDDAQQ
jgi:hypothetical protein